MGIDDDKYNIRIVIERYRNKRREMAGIVSEVLRENDGHRVPLLRTNCNIIYNGEKLLVARRNKVWTS